MRSEGIIKPRLFQPKDHVELGEKLEEIDFDSAIKISGARFVVLRGQLARLERALANFMLDHQVNEFGYLEVSPPALVNSKHFLELVSFQSLVINSLKQKMDCG